MALRVWLPLNGTLENQGLGTLSSPFSVNNPVWEAGKIGNNLYLEQQTTNTVTISELVNATIMSCSFWFKLQENKTYTAWNDLISFGIANTNSSGLYRLEVTNSAGEYINWYGNGYITDGSGAGGQTITPGIWYHMTMVIDDNNIYTYINGELKATKSLGTYKDSYWFTGTMKFGDTGNLYVTLADIRVYDESLSDKQVKEISKGLIAHYELEGIGANKNYIRNSDWSEKTNAGLYKFNGDVVTFEATEFNQNGNSFGCNLDSAGLIDFKNKTLTFSMEYKIDTPLTFGTTNPWVGFEMSVTRNTTTGGNSQWLDWYGGKNIPVAVTDGWVKYSKTVTVTNYDIASLFVSFYLRDTIGKISYRHPKIEVGNIATKWIPNENDNLYTSLGYDNNICTDVSGNKYNLIKTGTLTFNNDSPRYDGSTFFGNGNYLKTSSGSANWFNFDDLTISCWLNPSSKPSNWTGSVGIQHDGISAYKTFSISNYGGKFSIQTVDGANWQTVSFSEDLPLNTWSYCVVTLQNETNLKMYLNGQLVKEAVLNWGTAIKKDDMRFAIGVDFPGSDEYFDGSISDVRFYCTALSADDILTMYENSGIIDNKNNVYAYEFKEE